MPNSALRNPIDPMSDSVNFEDLLHQLDAQFAELGPAMIDRFQFDLDGIAFDVRRVAQTKGHRFVIAAAMGYLPFSIESSERRQAIRAIIEATVRLPNVRFTIDHSSKITAGGVFSVVETKAPDFVFYPLSLFLQEARPFMQLIGQYL